MKTSKPKPIKIIHDDREKTRFWDAKYLGKDFTCERSRLKTGDYTIHGMEDILCIERKNSWLELAGNIGTAKARKRFIAELQRMRKFPYRLLVVEDIIATIDTSRYRGNWTGARQIKDWLIRLPLEFGVPTMAVGARNYNKDIVRSILKKYAELRKEGRLYEY